MKINTCLLLSVAAAIAFAHQPEKAKDDHSRDLYARNRFTEKRGLPIIDDLLGGLGGAAQTTTPADEELLKRGLVPNLPVPGLDMVTDLLENALPLKKRRLPIIGDLLGGLGGAAQSTTPTDEELLKRGLVPNLPVPGLDMVTDLLENALPLKKRRLPIIGDLLGGLGGAAQSTTLTDEELLKRGLVPNLPVPGLDMVTDLLENALPLKKRRLPIIGDLLGGLGGTAQSTTPTDEELLKRGLVPNLPVPGLDMVTDLLENALPLKKRRLPIIGDLLGGLGGAAQSTTPTDEELLKRGLVPNLPVPGLDMVTDLLENALPLKKRRLPIIGDLLGGLGGATQGAPTEDLLKRGVVPDIGGGIVPDVSGLPGLDMVGGLVKTATDTLPIKKRRLPIVGDLLGGLGGATQGAPSGGLLKKRGGSPLGVLPLDMITGLVKGAVPNVGLNKKTMKRDDHDFSDRDFPASDFNDEECEEWADVDDGHNPHHGDHDGNPPHHGNHDGHPPHHGNHDGHPPHHGHHDGHPPHHGHHDGHPPHHGDHDGHPPHHGDHDGHPPHHGDHDGHPPHHGDHHGSDDGNNDPCDYENEHSNHHDGHHSSHGGGGVDIDLDVVIKAKIDIIAKALIGITVDALIDIKADIVAKILLKLNLKVDVDVDIIAKIKAIVHAKVDATVKVYVNTGIKTTISNSVHGHCRHSCSSDSDSEILADIIAKIKLDLGNILVNLDADILADISVNLKALGLNVKANIDLALGLNLKVIIGGLVSSWKEASSGLLIKLRAVVKV